VTTEAFSQPDLLGELAAAEETALREAVRQDASETGASTPTTRSGARRKSLHAAGSGPEGGDLVTEKFSYPEWRQTWPKIIVRTETGAAVDYLERYYAVDAKHKPHFTGSRFEAFAGRSDDPNAFGPWDFLAVSMLSVDVPAEAAIRLLERDAGNVQKSLSQIPADVDIVDVEVQTLLGNSPAGHLWDVLRQGRDRLGPTTTSKLLAAKRPRLLPIWDSFVGEATGLGTIGYWWKFQYVLNDDHRLIWNWLGELRGLASNAPDSVSELRILDVLLWMSVESRFRPR
jgi:hypothetical protein